jgi:restriction endonuclease Mrr
VENKVTKKFIESLEWRSFEEFCYLIFKSSNKWQVELNSFGADAGADIILKNKDTGKISAIVQCKAFNAKNVIKVKLVRELLGSMKDLGAQQGIFITTSSYTEDASEFAKKKTRFVQLLLKICCTFSVFFLWQNNRKSTIALPTLTIRHRSVLLVVSN